MEEPKSEPVITWNASPLCWEKIHFREENSVKTQLTSFIAHFRADVSLEGTKLRDKPHKESWERQRYGVIINVESSSAMPVINRVES